MLKLALRLKSTAFFLPIGALTCALLWGSAFPAIRLSHAYFDTGPLQNHFAFAGIRFTLAGIIVLAFQKRLIANFKLCPKWGLLGVTVFQVVLQYMFFYWGLKLAPAVLVAIVMSAGSFWWVLLAPLLDKNEALSFKQFLLLIVGFVGVCFCVMDKQGGGDSLFSVLLIVLASLCGVVAVLLVKPKSKKVSGPYFTGIALFFGCLILCSTAPQVTVVLIREMNWHLLLLTLWLAIVSSAAFSLWYYLISLFDVPRLSAYRLLIPLCGVLESIIILPDESLSGKIFCGGLLVLTSIFFLEKMKKS
ncbi:MAG: DMT family transporter [Lentisphaeraceae bacterium]|nr:DMT family transporter [Lentisphaeraceae bacterium]